MDMFIASAWAQAATPGAGPTPNPLMQFIPLLLIFAVFYFLMIRPQKKRLVEEQNFLKALAKGDEIYTKSGMIGTIAGMAEQFITLEVAEGVKIKVVKNQIGGPLKNLLAPATATEPAKNKKK